MITDTTESRHSRDEQGDREFKTSLDYMILVPKSKIIKKKLVV